MKDVNELVRTVFSGLSPLVIEDVVDEGEQIVVRAVTAQDTGLPQVWLTLRVEWCQAACAVV